jgi:putative hydrolase of the HAD superfamily
VKVVFDLGGVVYRWRPDEFLTRLAPERAATPEAAQAFAADFFQSFDGDWSEFDRGTLEAEVLARRTAARLGVALDEARAVIDAVPAELQPIEATVALAARLKGAGHVLHFLSNMPRPYAAALTTRDALFALFESGVFSSHVGLIKPEPAFFEHAARAFDARPRDLLLVDDVQRNVAAAQAAGWRAVLFRDAAQCAGELAALGIAAS